MDFLILIGLGLILLFGFVLLFGAPYLPTLAPQIETAFELADLSKGQRMVELGCGDGKVLIAAAERGIKSTGYELNPILALISWLRARKYKGLVTVKWGNFWTSKLPETEVIFTFLLPKYMIKLDKKIAQEYNGKEVKLVSIAFEIPSKKAAKVEKGVFLYQYN